MKDCCPTKRFKIDDPAAHHNTDTLPPPRQ